MDKKQDLIYFIAVIVPRPHRIALTKICWHREKYSNARTKRSGQTEKISQENLRGERNILSEWQTDIADNFLLCWHSQVMDKKMNQLHTSFIMSLIPELWYTLTKNQKPTRQLHGPVRASHLIFFLGCNFKTSDISSSFFFSNDHSKKAS